MTQIVQLHAVIDGNAEQACLVLNGNIIMETHGQYETSISGIEHAAKALSLALRGELINIEYELSSNEEQMQAVVNNLIAQGKVNDPKDISLYDTVQLPKLLSKIKACVEVKPKDWRYLSDSMKMPVDEINTLWGRATHCVERLKNTYLID